MVYKLLHPYLRTGGADRQGVPDSGGPEPALPFEHWAGPGMANQLGLVKDSGWYSPAPFPKKDYSSPPLPKHEQWQDSVAESEAARGRVGGRGTDTRTGPRRPIRVGGRSSEIWREGGVRSGMEELEGGEPPVGWRSSESLSGREDRQAASNRSNENGREEQAAGGGKHEPRTVPRALTFTGEAADAGRGRVNGRRKGAVEGSEASRWEAGTRVQFQGGPKGGLLGWPGPGSARADHLGPTAPGDSECDPFWHDDLLI